MLRGADLTGADSRGEIRRRDILVARIKPGFPGLYLFPPRSIRNCLETPAMGELDPQYLVLLRRRRAFTCSLAPCSYSATPSLPRRQLSPSRGTLG